MRWDRVQWAAWIIGGAGLLVAMLGWLLEPIAFPYAWLAALTSWVGWPLGCLALLLVHALTGGQWGYTIRPYLLAGIETLPLLLPMIVPIMFVLPELYPWLRPEIAHDLPNRFYLNAPFALGRGFVYLIIWFSLAALVLRAVRRGGPSTPLASIGLILLGLTVSFSAMDATMSLDPHFVSSAYGMIAAAQGGLLALSVCVLAAAADVSLPTYALDDLGRLLQGLLVLWAYLDFVQFLIVWQSNLPHEARWYVERSTPGWGIVAGLVALGHFLLPFIALVVPRVRRSRYATGSTATLLIVMEVVRGWWLVLPASDGAVGWVDIAAVLAIGGFSAGLALRGAGTGATRLRLSHG